MAAVFSDKSDKQALGASFVEVAISLPLFVVSVIFMIDFTRYFFIYIFLHYAAQQAVDYASKIEVELNTHACVLDCLGQDHDRCNAHRSLILTVMNRARNLAELVASPSSQWESGARLVSFRHYDSSQYNTCQECNCNACCPGGCSNNCTSFLPIDSDVAFLRPGEIVCRDRDCSLEANRIEHPTRPFGVASYEGWPQVGEGWAAVLEAHPLMVRIEVIFNPITPFVPNLRIGAQQFAFRRSREFGANAPNVLPSPTPLPPPTNTPIPTATFTPHGWQPPTPTPTDTGTPTWTPTETLTPTITNTPTLTPVESFTPTLTNTPTRTFTQTLTPTITNTQTRTPTPTRTASCNSAPCFPVPDECYLQPPHPICVTCGHCPGCPCPGYTPGGG